jgi:hypothetical protein
VYKQQHNTRPSKVFNTLWWTTSRWTTQQTPYRIKHSILHVLRCVYAIQPVRCMTS